MMRRGEALVFYDDLYFSTKSNFLYYFVLFRLNEYYIGVGGHPRPMQTCSRIA